MAKITGELRKLGKKKSRIIVAKTRGGGTY